MANELRTYQNFLGGRLTYALPAATTTVTDGATTNASTTVTSATAAFTAADVGAPISGTNIPANSYIVSVTDGTTVVISAAATATGSGITLTIDRHKVMHSAALAAMNVVGTTAHMMCGLDIDGLAGEPEIVMVTKHDSAATWAQITRAQDGTTARSHAAGMDWVHGPIASDASRPGAKAMRTANASAGNDYAFTSTSWAAVDATNLALSVPASAGDQIEVGLSCRIDSEAFELYLDVGTIVSSSLVNFVSGLGTGGSTRGVQAWTGLISVVSHVGGSVLYTVQAGDLASGAVALHLYGRLNAAGTKSINAQANIPVHFWVKNLGKVI